MKEHQEGAEPSAMAVSVANLYRLAHLLDDKRDDYAHPAQACVIGAGSLLKRAPFAMGTLTGNALLDEEEEGIKQVRPSHCVRIPLNAAQIIVTGSLSDEKTKQLLSMVRGRFMPNRLLILLSPKTPQDYLASKNDVVRSLVEGGQHKESAARICEGRVCGLPISDPAELEKALDAKQEDV